MKEILKKYFLKIQDYLIISKSINNDEIIIRVLLRPKHLKEEIFEEKYFKEYFLPLHGGVSVNRHRYMDENEAKKFAMNKFHGVLKYAGFAVFDVNMVWDSLDEYRNKTRDNDFLVNIFASPLNKNEDAITKKTVFRFIKGNLAHADIVYYPGQVHLESPNTAYRVFSKILASKCKKLMDENLNSDYWNGDRFKDIVNS